MCKFYLNSLLADQARILTVEVWNTKKETDKETQIGFGIYDLEPYILPKKKRTLITSEVKKGAKKCYLNYQHRPAGNVELDVSFE